MTTNSQASKMFASCKATRISQLQPSAVQQAIAGLREAGRSLRTG